MASVLLRQGQYIIIYQKVNKEKKQTRSLAPGSKFYFAKHQDSIIDPLLFNTWYVFYFME